MKGERTPILMGQARTDLTTMNNLKTMRMGRALSDLVTFRIGKARSDLTTLQMGKTRSDLTTIQMGRARSYLETLRIGRAQTYYLADGQSRTRLVRDKRFFSVQTFVIYFNID